MVLECSFNEVFNEMFNEVFNEAVHLVFSEDNDYLSPILRKLMQHYRIQLGSLILFVSSILTSVPINPGPSGKSPPESVINPPLPPLGLKVVNPLLNQ